MERMEYKTTVQQYAILLQELKENEVLKTNKNPLDNPNALEETWAKLTEVLNDAEGPVRSTKAWKKELIAWKNRVMTKSGLYVSGVMEIGAGPLTKMEADLLDTIKDVDIEDGFILEESIEDLDEYSRVSIATEVILVDEGADDDDHISADYVVSSDEEDKTEAVQAEQIYVEESPKEEATATETHGRNVVIPQIHIVEPDDWFTSLILNVDIDLV